MRPCQPGTTAAHLQPLLCPPPRLPDEPFPPHPSAGIRGGKGAHEGPSIRVSSCWPRLLLPWHSPVDSGLCRTLPALHSSQDPMDEVSEPPDYPPKHRRSDRVAGRFPAQALIKEWPRGDKSAPKGG